MRPSASCRGIASRIGRLAATGLRAGAAIAIVPAMASASSFQVSPVMLTLPARHPMGSLSFRNAADEAVSIKVATYRWTQVDGRDVYTPTDDLIASPPIFTSDPHATQLVRVGLRRSVADTAYRVILEEIPKPSKDKGIRIAMNLNLPLYIAEAAATKADTRWSGWRTADGNVVLEARNDGGTYQQIVGIDLVGPGKPAVLTTAMGVVLPASMRRWTLGKHPELPTGTPLHLSIRTADGDSTVTATLAAR